MFENLQERLSNIFNQLTGRGALSEEDVDKALREIRRALLEADVALDAVRYFTERVKKAAIGQEILKSIKPGQMVVKIVHDELVAILGTEDQAISLQAPSPVPILMVGLQGAGKTTTSAKIAKRFKERDKKKVLLASLDTSRPAAQEQLRQLAEQIEVASLPIIAGQNARDIAQRALITARQQGFDVVILDSAGRTHIDKGLMEEVRDIKNLTKAHEILLVADSLTGQDAVNVAQSFNKELDITGIILTRMDGDGRGGAALSMRYITGKPIKAISVGERLHEIEDFYPKRIADRILAMGDIVSLVESAAQNLDQAKAEKLAKKMQAGRFDLEDMREQILQMKRIGGLGGIMAKLPGLSSMKQQMSMAGLNDQLLNRQLAIISSMTVKERQNPEIIKHKRKQRIAKGSGTNAAEINKLLKMHREMSAMIKSVKKGKGAFGGGILSSLTSPFSNNNPFKTNQKGDNSSDLADLGQDISYEDMLKKMQNKDGNFFNNLPFKLPGLPKNPFNKK